LPSETEDIIERLGAREVIGRAVDLLMDRGDVSRDDAFELLVQGSSESHQKVPEKAAEIIQQRKGSE